GTEPWRSAGGDKDIPRPDRFSGRDETRRMRIFQHGTALGDFDPGTFEGGGIGEFKPRNLKVLVGDERRPVELRFVYRPAVAGRVLEVVGKARGIDEELLRNAAADHASAADAVLLGDQNARAISGRDPRSAHPARACSDDEEIDVMISHI